MTISQNGTHLKPPRPPWWIRVPRILIRDPSLSMTAKGLACLLLDYGAIQGFTWIGPRLVKQTLKISDEELQDAAQQLYQQYGVAQIPRSRFTPPEGATPPPMDIHSVWDIGPLLQLLEDPEGEYQGDSLHSSPQVGTPPPGEENVGPSFPLSLLPSPPPHEDSLLKDASAEEARGA